MAKGQGMSDAETVLSLVSATSIQTHVHLGCNSFVVIFHIAVSYHGRSLSNCTIPSS